MATTRTVVLPMEPHPALGDTLSAASSAYRRLSEIAFSGGFISRYKLHKAAYAEVKATRGLTAQMVCSTIRTVAATYKSAKSNGHKLDEPASFSGRCIDLEGGSGGRDFSIYPGKGIVSISTVEGRKKLSYRCGDFQRGYLESPDWKIQSAKLLYNHRRKGWRYELHVTVIREESEQRAVGVLGVDTGRRYLAVATTGDDAHFFPAGHLKPKKEHCRRIRGKLKSKGTRSSTRTFNRVAGRGARLVEDMQHCTAKELVRLALESGCGAIAVERLNGIGARTGARGRKARYHYGMWAYVRFLDILRYKAEGAGLDVIEVDPANTSRVCNNCGRVDKANRKGLSFSCMQCGYSLHADLSAARNLRQRAIVGRQAPAHDGPASCGPEADSGPLRTASCLLWLAVHDTSIFYLDDAPLCDCKIMELIA